MAEHTTHTKSTIAIYSQKLAGILMYNGFRLIDVDRNINDPKMNVFIFSYSDALHNIVDDYKSGKLKLELDFSA